jgi:hypothetical protein
VKCEAVTDSDHNQAEPHTTPTPAVSDSFVINQKVKIKSDDNTVGLSSGKSGWGTEGGGGDLRLLAALVPRHSILRMSCISQGGEAWEYLAPFIRSNRNHAESIIATKILE